MGASHRHAHRRWTRLGACIAAVSITTFAFATTSSASAPDRVRHQKPKGEVTFGLEAETTNYCLTRAQLAISGIQVVAAVYDTLTVPNAKGVAVPYLAKSVEPNADFTEWTIGLRPNVQFQNGEPVDADAVKLNLDNFRGAEGATQNGPLFTIVLKFIQDVQVVDPQTVKVTLNTPVVDFPNYLYSTGRFGIMAPEQINAGADCATKMIGSGPFKLEEYQQNEKTVVVANPNYWQKGYPKVQQITFVPVPEAAVRVNQLQGGQLDLMHTSSANAIDTLRGFGPSTAKLLTQKPGVREIRYYVLLSDDPPFDNPDARQAFAMALDRDEINTIVNKGLFDRANGLMDKDVPGYEKDAGYPKHNVKKAKSLASQVKSSAGSFNVILGTTTDPENSREAQLMKEQLGKANIDAEIAQFDQATLINKALSGDIDVLLWRNLHGGFTSSADSDNYPWWSNYDEGNLINFPHFSNPDTQALLDQGRGESEKSQIEKTFTDFNKAMAKGIYILPVWYVDWTIGYAPNVKIGFPPLPDGQGKPLFVYGRIPVLGISTS
ncbi:MAG TPA: ABC transporter substrate-binding protein [Acidimicrobiia bacterium]